MKNLKHLFLAFALLLGAPAWSADTMSKPVIDPDLERAQSLIERKEWTPAVQLLEGFTRSHPSNADGFNLLGYSYRNLKRMDEAFAAYGKALKLDPEHKGAHEYIGIAYIQIGQLAKAKEHLDALDKICVFSCEEFRDLKKALADANKAKAK